MNQHFGPTVICDVSFRTCKRGERKPKPSDTPKGPSPARVRLYENAARRLALGHLIEKRIASGDLRDYQHAADVLGLTSPRVLQIVNLTLLAPDLQAALLDGALLVTERQLRDAVQHASWAEQRETLERLRAASA